VLNFAPDMDLAASATPAIVEQAPVIQERVSFRRPETRATDVGKDPAAWTWEDLRNYVVRQIEAIHGPFPRDPVKEASIFRSFASRWGAQAGSIAQFALEDCEGRWAGAPISVTRFCKASDQYFAAPIAERLQS
jgi:hypothetical protein